MRAIILTAASVVVLPIYAPQINYYYLTAGEVGRFCCHCVLFGARYGRMYLFNFFLPMVFLNKIITQYINTRIAFKGKSLQLIWRSGTRRFHLRVSDLQMSFRDLTSWQDTRTVVPAKAVAELNAPFLSRPRDTWLYFYPWCHEGLIPTVGCLYPMRINPAAVPDSVCLRALQSMLIYTLPLKAASGEFNLVGQLEGVPCFTQFQGTPTTRNARFTLSPVFVITQRWVSQWYCRWFVQLKRHCQSRWIVHRRNTKLRYLIKIRVFLDFM